MPLAPGRRRPDPGCRRLFWLDKPSRAASRRNRGTSSSSTRRRWHRRSKLSGTFYRPDTPGPWPWRCSITATSKTRQPQDRPSLPWSPSSWSSKGMRSYPMRRGLGQSAATLPERAPKAAGAFEGRGRDLEATLAAIRQNWHDIAPGPVLMTGQSAGGVLSPCRTQAATQKSGHAELLRAAGRSRAAETTRIFAELGRRARAVPTLWLYASNELHYTPRWSAATPRLTRRRPHPTAADRRGPRQGWPLPPQRQGDVGAMGLALPQPPSPANNLVPMTPDEAQAAAKAAQAGVGRWRLPPTLAARKTEGSGRKGPVSGRKICWPDLPPSRQDGAPTGGPAGWRRITDNAGVTARRPSSSFARQAPPVRASGKSASLADSGGAAKLPGRTAPACARRLTACARRCFNWLGQDLTGWHCADLFAGTGALGFRGRLTRGSRSLVGRASP